MDNRPIGVFDSGLGGLTAVRQLLAELPHEDIIYLGDTGRVPYGGRSRETIIKYARQDMAFLTGFDIKAVIVACGTVSATALDTVRAEFDLPVFGVVEPAAQAAAAATRSGRIGIIGTAASIRSGAYDRLLRQYLPTAEIVSAACPLLVPLVENGRIHRGDILIETAVREYLTPMKDAGVDTLILGCTHYPLLEAVIGDFMGPVVRLIDPGAAVVSHAAEVLQARGLEAESRDGSSRYFVTDSTEGFEAAAGLFLGRDLHGKAEKTDVSIL